MSIRKRATPKPRPAKRDERPSLMQTVEIAVGPNPDGLRHQTVIAHQPDDAAREAARAALAAEPQHNPEG